MKRRPAGGHCSPGGSTIITSVYVYETTLNVVTYGMPLEEVMAAKRYHHQWLPYQTFMEEGAFPPAVADSLREMGNKLETRGPVGRVDAILLQPDGLLKGVGVSRGGRPGRWPSRAGSFLKF